jgi:hypothetical protein
MGTSMSYATNTSGAFVVSEVMAQSRGDKVAIAADALGNPHLTFFSYNGTDQSVMHAQHDTGAWVVTPIGSFSNQTADMTLAADSSGALHMIYTKIGYLSADIGRYEVYTAATGWTVVNSELQLSNQDFGTDHMDLAIDLTGHVHLSMKYYRCTGATTDTCGYALEYMTNAYGQWNAEYAATSDRHNVGLYSSIVVDADGNAHIAYFDESNTELHYVNNVAGDWANSIVDTAGQVGRYTAIGLDAHGEIHIVYQDFSRNQLKHASGHADAWQTEIVDQDYPVGIDADMVVQGNDLHAVYVRNSSPKEVRYAHGVCP